METDVSNARQWTIRIAPWWTVMFMGIAIVVFAGVAWNAGNVSWESVGILLVAILAPLALDEWVACQLDLDQRMITLQNRRTWRSTLREFALDDVHTIAVQCSIGSDSSVYRVVFTLKSGEVIPITHHYSSNKRSKEDLARKIAAYINQGRAAPVNLALNGIVSIRQNGVTDGVNWQLEFVANNDSGRLTRWQTTHTGFSDGFLLLIPAINGHATAMPGGILGTFVRFIYQQYLNFLDFDGRDLSGFESAEVLRGDAFGLDSHITLVTGAPDTANRWLNHQRVRQLNAWIQSNPLDAGAAAIIPHIIVTPQDLRLVFRGEFNHEDQIAAIARLGADLAQ